MNLLTYKKIYIHNVYITQCMDLNYSMYYISWKKYIKYLKLNHCKQCVNCVARMNLKSYNPNIEKYGRLYTFV